MKQEINIPKLGSEMKTGQILEWHVKVGDHVEEDQDGHVELHIAHGQADGSKVSLCRSARISSWLFR